MPTHSCQGVLVGAQRLRPEALVKRPEALVKRPEALVKRSEALVKCPGVGGASIAPLHEITIFRHQIYHLDRAGIADPTYNFNA